MVRVLGMPHTQHQSREAGSCMGGKRTKTAPATSNRDGEFCPTPRQAQREQTDSQLTPFAAKVSFALDETRNLMKLSAVSGCDAFVVSTAVNVR